MITALWIASFGLLSLLIGLFYKYQKLLVRCAIAEERLQATQVAHDQLAATFKALSGEALEKNSQSFWELAGGEWEKRDQQLSQMMQKLNADIRKLEEERKTDHGSLRQHLHSLLESERHLQRETGNLVKALRSPVARGRWGEIQLRRVVEMAGMLKHCDFLEQQYHAGDAGHFRPDLIVKLPGNRQVIVDAKVALDAYLDAIQSSNDQEKEAKLKEHARQVRTHVQALGKKGYWDHFQPTPEFVILFLPSEAIFSAALEHDPSLIEMGVEEGVILATPTTLIALLRAVAYGWKQESLSLHAEHVSELGHELYKRIIDMNDHWSKMGRSLSTVVDSYNKAVGSLESRVLVTARKFKDLGIGSATVEIQPTETVEQIPRHIQAPEMISKD
jgi:DNA recombination protein RmuC